MMKQLEYLRNSCTYYNAFNLFCKLFQAVALRLFELLVDVF